MHQQPVAFGKTTLISAFMHLTSCSSAFIRICYSAYQNLSFLLIPSFNQLLFLSLQILERITPVPSNYTRSSRSSSVASQPHFAQIRTSIASKSPSIISMQRGSSSRSSHGHMARDPSSLLRPDICNISQPKSVDTYQITCKLQIPW